MPSLTWSLIEGVVQGHLLEKPQKVLTFEECRFSLEDRLRSPNSSRLGVCVQVCVCKCVCVCVCACKCMCVCADDNGSVLPSGLRDLFRDRSTGISWLWGEEATFQDKDF